MSDFPALPGLYQLMYLYIEPASTILPALLIWYSPGPSWFYHELVPASGPAHAIESLDARTKMAMYQLGNCYFLLGLISTFVFRAVRDALPNNPVAQERIVGATFTALAIADITHMLWTWIELPSELQYNPLAWNSMTHGNISFVIVLLAGRLAWFFGIGRKTYYYGQQEKVKRKA